MRDRPEGSTFELFGATGALGRYVISLEHLITAIQLAMPRHVDVQQPEVILSPRAAAKAKQIREEAPQAVGEMNLA